MSDAAGNPLEDVLRRIARAAPEPWYPYRGDGFDRNQLDDVLEALWLQELIQKASPTVPDAGPAVALTPLGQRVLDDPEMLDRLGRGQAIDPTNIAHVVRANLIHAPRVWVCKLILVANILVYLWGLFLAWRLGIARSFLVGFTMGQNGLNILHATGGISGEDLVRGEWWRLITSGFNHIGLIHLGMNMYGLYSVGYFIEQRWGWWRFLVIYFLSVWTSACLAMSYQPQVFTVGASGGLFGVFAALIGWLLLYGKYLPVWLRKRAWRSVMINVLILSVLSYMLRDMISHWGHIGGAIGGFAACFVLHFLRFGPLVLRAAALPMLVLLPYLAYAHLENARGTNKNWPDVELREFNEHQIKPIGRITREAVRVYGKTVDPQLERHPERREESEVKAALSALEESLQRLHELARNLQRAGPYRDPEVEKARATALAYADALIDLFEETSRCLQAGKAWKHADEKLLQEKQQAVRKARSAWEDLFS